MSGYHNFLYQIGHKLTIIVTFSAVLLSYILYVTSECVQSKLDWSANEIIILKLDLEA